MMQDLKTFQRLMLLLTVVAVLLGWCYLSALLAPEKQEKLPVYALDIPVSQISAIAIKNAAGVLTLFQNNQGLTVMQDEAVAAVDIVAAQSMYYELCHLSAKRTFSQEELSIDFTRPLAQIGYMDMQGRAKSYLVANVRGPFDEYYLSEQGGELVYLIAPQLGQYFEMSALQLQDKSVLPNLTSATIPLIDRVEIKDFHGQNSYQISCSNEGGLLLYTFDAPVNNRIEANVVWEQLFVPLSKMYGENTISLDAAITEPDFRISATIEGKDYSFFVKTTPEETVIYRENEMVCFSIPSEKIAFLAQTHESFLQGKAFSVAPGYLERVTMRMDGQAYAFELKETEGGMTIAYQGETFLYADQTERFRPLFEIPIQSSLEPSDSTIQEPMLTIQYDYKNGVVDVISLRKTEQENQFAVESNGVSYFTTFASTVERLMQIVG